MSKMERYRGPPLCGWGR